MVVNGKSTKVKMVYSYEPVYILGYLMHLAATTNVNMNYFRTSW